MKKISVFFCTLSVLLLCSCTQQSAERLPGFLSCFNAAFPVATDYGDLITCREDADTVYLRFFPSEQGKILLSVREDAATKLISCCCVTAKAAGEEQRQVAAAALKALSGVTDDEAQQALTASLAEDVCAGECIVHTTDSELACCTFIEKERFCGRTQAVYSQPFHTSGQ